jgi:Family of unknown function (DUF5880)
MSASIPSKAASAAPADNIAALLKSAGPTVRCVLLRHMRPSGRDVHPHVDASVVVDPDPTVESKQSAGPVEPNDGASEDPHPHHLPRHREILTELIEEVSVDTTPGNNGVQNVLGGKFTFIGQYPDEGIILMARADQFADLEDVDSLTIHELKEVIQDNPDITVNLATLLDKSDLVQAVKDALLPINPHILQPPFDDCTIRGDVLLMRVADENDDDDDEGDDPATNLSNAMDNFTNSMAIPNDEFFLDYTKEEYIAFASRTDIVAPAVEDDEEDEDYMYGNGEHSGDDEGDEEFNVDALDEEDDKRVLLNLILGEVIKSFRHENGRGPDSEELLELRSQVAEKLHLTLPPRAPPVEGKRKGEDHEPSPDSPSPKRVKFTPEIFSKSEESENAMNGAFGLATEDDANYDDDRKSSAVETLEEPTRLEEGTIDDENES